MGELNVFLPTSQKQVQSFVKRVLNDTKALEKMIYDGVFETGITRIGAEQEMNIIDKNYKPYGKSLELLEILKDDDFTTELALFNLEFNIPPIEFKENALAVLEKHIVKRIAKVRKAAQEIDAEVIMMGILPTIRKFDVDMNHLTPFERYKALMEAILKLRGAADMELNIEGIDELIIKHDSPLLEACNTGFQVHLQVEPDDFVNKYNIAQAIAGPAMASAVNSPILFGKRLWKETRIALFQQSTDTRTSRDHLRDRSPRVMFGHNYIKKSILEIYREDIMRFRVLLSSDLEENSLMKLQEGEIPKLHSLSIHNGTVYRWNRPCYGAVNGVPHLRIENRVLPAGPTVLDEVANAALWLGLLNGIGDHYKDITKNLEFDHAKSNFLFACRNGIDTSFNWVNGRKIDAKELLVKELVPIAKEGLAKNNIDAEDINKYLEVIEARCEKNTTGAQWVLDSYSKLTKSTTKDEAIVAITASTLKNQKTKKPVHQWALAGIRHLREWEPLSLSVEEFMTTDLFTVQTSDIIELVAEMMDAQKLRYIPVEDEDGSLKGLITSRILLRHYGRRHLWNDNKPMEAKAIMIKKPITIEANEQIPQALELMLKHEIGCLPVVKGNELVGIITEQDFVNITRRLLQRQNRL